MVSQCGKKKNTTGVVWDKIIYYNFEQKKARGMRRAIILSKRESAKNIGMFVQIHIQ
ncbi:unnamed protein product [Brassica oleracea]